MRLPSSKATEEEFVSRFVEGLKEEFVKYKVYEKEPAGLEEAIVQAERVTALRFGFRDRFPRSSSVASLMVSYTDATPIDEKRRCWNCQQPGHLFRDCPHPSSSSNRGGGRAPNRGSGRGGRGRRGRFGRHSATVNLTEVKNMSRLRPRMLSTERSREKRKVDRKTDRACPQRVGP